MLTRKSLVRPAYRGERPIERTSGWFPPKFLLGKRPSLLAAAVAPRRGESGPRSTRTVERRRPRQGRASGQGLVSSFCKAERTARTSKVPNCARQERPALVKTAGRWP